MNRIIREHYPVSKLPEDLREAVQGATVRVTLDMDDLSATASSDDRPVAKPGLFSQYRHLVKSRFSSVEEINDHVRALREEWDHRDR